MQTKSNIRGIRGSKLIYNRALRLRGMNEAEISRRLEVLDFSKKHGEKLAEEAFKVNKRTIRRSKKLLKDGEGRINVLSSKSRMPHKTRPSLVRQEIRDEILNQKKKHSPFHIRILTSILYPLLVILPFLE